jgi:hypothetical protein
MKSFVAKVALGASLALAAVSAQANVAQAHSYTFFDENGTVVGQTIILCTNASGSYGNVHTAYSITQYSPCSTETQQHPASIVPGTHVTAYTLPGFLTIQQACMWAHCDDSGVLGLTAYWPIQLYGPWVTP